MHGQNNWGLYYPTHKSTQIFFGFTFPFHLKIVDFNHSWGDVLYYPINYMRGKR